MFNVGDYVRVRTGVLRNRHAIVIEGGSFYPNRIVLFNAKGVSGLDTYSLDINKLTLIKSRTSLVNREEVRTRVGDKVQLHTRIGSKLYYGISGTIEEVEGKSYLISYTKIYSVVGEKLVLTEANTNKPFKRWFYRDEFRVVVSEKKKKAAVREKKKGAKPTKDIALERAIEIGMAARSTPKKVLRGLDENITQKINVEHPVCKYAVVFPNGNFYSNLSTICHRGLNRWTNKGAKYIVNHLMNCPEGLTDDQKMFYDWFLNEGPYAPLYVTKTAQEAWENGVIVSTNHPRTLVHLACIISRFTGERLPCLKAWINMVKAGCDKRLAFVLCMGVVGGNDEGELTRYLANGHLCYYGQRADIKDLGKVMSWDEKDYTKTFYSKTLTKKTFCDSPVKDSHLEFQETYGYGRNLADETTIYSVARKAFEKVSKNKSKGVFGGGVSIIEKDDIMKFVSEFLILAAKAH